MKKQICLIGLAIIVFSCQPRVEPKSLDELVQNAIQKLTSASKVIFDFSYHGEDWLAEETVPYQGNIEVTPLKEAAAFPFENMKINAISPKTKDEIHLSKIGQDIFYLEPASNTLWQSNLRSLGGLLYSQKVQFCALPYQYLQLLQQYQDFNAKLGEPIKQGLNLLQPVIFDIPQEGFYAEIYIDAADFHVEKIITRQEKDSKHANLVYEIKNFKTSEKIASAEDFKIKISENIIKRSYTVGGPSIGESAPDWKTSDYEGKEIMLSDFAGKVVVMDFWATWCQPCHNALAAMSQLQQKLKDKPVVFLALTFQDNGKPIDYMKEKGYQFTLLKGDPIAAEFAVDKTGLPTLYILDKIGKVVEYEVGYLGNESDQHIEAIITRLLDL
ncbi:MAG: TlpA family protein disulfide reductase [Saprospiraceae bacterium]|nr:TlpA family protein disulfide reductase [Saprospiraceae bacterium]